MNKVSKLFFLIPLALIATASFADEDTSKDNPAKHVPHHTAAVKTEAPVEVPDVVPDTAEKAEEPESPFTGSFAITSNYLFRGISNSWNLPAIQGGFTYTFINLGLYFNIWGSNVYMLTGHDRTATVEVDGVIGVTNEVGENFSYNVSFSRYGYPKAQELAYNEAIAVLSYYFLTATIAYSGNEFNTHVPGWYYNLGVGFDIPCDWFYISDLSIAAGVGYYDLDPKTGNSYLDYSVSLSKKFNDTFTGQLSWTDTNHKFSNDSLDHYHVFVTLSANF